MNTHPRGSECDEGYGCECDLNKARAINNKIMNKQDSGVQGECPAMEDYSLEDLGSNNMNTEDFNKAVKPLSDKWTEDLVKAELYYKRDIDEGILESCKGTDDAIREEIIKHIESNNQVPEKIQSLAEDILKLHRPDPQYSHHESSCRKCNSTEIDTVVAKQKEEIDKLKKELDNSKFGAQCSVHELEYDKKTLIKENENIKQSCEELIKDGVGLLKERDALMKALKSLVCTAEKDEINKDHLDVTLRRARNVIADIDPTIEKCDCCY